MNSAYFIISTSVPPPVPRASPPSRTRMHASPTRAQDIDDKTRFRSPIQHVAPGSSRGLQRSYSCTQIFSTANFLLACLGMSEFSRSRDSRNAFLYSHVYSLHLRRRSDPEGLLISDTGNDLRRCNYRHSSAFIAFYGDHAGTPRVPEFPVFLPPHPEEAAARVRCSPKRPEIGRGGNLIPERTRRTHSAAPRETGARSQLAVPPPSVLCALDSLIRPGSPSGLVVVVSFPRVLVHLPARVRARSCEGKREQDPCK